MTAQTTAQPAADQPNERYLEESGVEPDIVVSRNDLSRAVLPPVRRRVLIAEDDPAVRATVNQILNAQGYVVIEAEDGQVALGILRGSPIDVLILDLAMPGLDGMDLLRRIDLPPPVVIIHSAFAYRTPEQVQGDVGSKVFKILTKPTPPADLVAAVAEAIEAIETERV